VLNEAELGEFIDSHFSTTLFRLETLERYDVESDGWDFEAYLAGKPSPVAAGKEAWLEQLRQEAAAGKHSQRLRVVGDPLSEYIRYECEWGYTYNAAAGEEIRVLDLGQVDWRADLLADEQDFYVIDEHWLVRMHYDDEGRFLGAQVVDDPEELERALGLVDHLWTEAMPFADWWTAHPEYWRSNWAA
jgi:hypothetical protein